MLFILNSVLHIFVFNFIKAELQFSFFFYNFGDLQDTFSGSLNHRNPPLPPGVGEGQNVAKISKKKVHSEATELTK